MYIAGDGLKVSKTGTVFGMNIHLPTFWGSRGYHSFDPCHQVDDGELLRAIREAGYEDRLIVSKQRVAEGNNIAFSCIVLHISIYINFSHSKSFSSFSIS